MPAVTQGETPCFGEMKSPLTSAPGCPVISAGWLFCRIAG